jgi:hypothetical protein
VLSRTLFVKKYNFPFLSTMPQFDTFSFFSQLFWVLLGFSYLYLLLCLYILPAFAAILKIRAKKLAQITSSSDNADVVAAPMANSLFFENLTVKFNLDCSRSDLTGGINSSFNHLVLKNEAFYKFNFLLLNEFKITVFFL